jgi:hypothetical protein
MVTVFEVIDIFIGLDGLDGVACGCACGCAGENEGMSIVLEYAIGRVIGQGSWTEREDVKITSKPVGVEDFGDRRRELQLGKEGTTVNRLCAFPHLPFHNILETIEQARVFIKVMTELGMTGRAIDEDRSGPDATAHGIDGEIDQPLTLNEEEIIEDVDDSANGYRGIICGLPYTVEEEHDTPSFLTRRL